MVALAAKAKRRRFVYSSANVIDFELERLEPKRANVKLFHLGVRLADTIIVQTDEQVALCEGRFGRTPVVIRSLAEPAEPRAGAGDSFLWIGRLRPYKRPLAFVELAKAIPEARFKMIAVPAGDPPEGLDAEVEAACREVPNLELLPPLPRAQVLEIMDTAVAIVNTADYEGMPNIFLEGWARGVPALALTHDPDGVIERERVGAVAGGSIERLVDLARKMWASSDDQQELARRCRDYIQREHSPEAVSDRWLEALRLPCGR
jgi:glycosyltransferase involved in cell wall biosynthesis